LQPLDPMQPILKLYRVRSIRLVGLTFRGEGQGLEIDKSRHVTVAHCTFDGLTRELSVRSSHDLGSHVLFVCDVINEAGRTERQMAFVSGMYQEWLAARGIGYVVMVVPEKFTIYPEYLPSWVARSPSPTPHDQLSAAMRRNGRVAFIDLREPLRAAKVRERVYYQTDSHWNFNGAIVGYEALMREVQRALPDKLPSVAPAKRPAYSPGVDFYTGDLLHMLAMPELREDDVAPLGKVLADVASRCARRIDKDEFPGFEYYVCDRPGLPRAVVLRDSMAISLIPLLSENFSRTVYVSTRKFDRAMIDLIEREKPDIVIEELVERSIHAPGAYPMDRSP